MRGEFFHSDGHKWKPSQGERKVGRRLRKRYFYSRTLDGISRHISSIKIAGESWTFIEYHFGNMTRPRYENIDTLMGPTLWSKMMREVENIEVEDSFSCSSTDNEIKEEPLIEQVISLKHLLIETCCWSCLRTPRLRSGLWTISNSIRCQEMKHLPLSWTKRTSKMW